MRGVVVLACVSIFLQPSLSPQDTPIRSVRVSLKAKPHTKVQVVIESLSDSPLLESTIGLFAPGEASPRVFHYSNFQNDHEGLRKEGVVAVPIASRGRRVISRCSRSTGPMDAGADARDVRRRLLRGDARHVDGVARGSAEAG